MIRGDEVDEAGFLQADEDEDEESGDGESGFEVRKIFERGMVTPPIIEKLGDGIAVLGEDLGEVIGDGGWGFVPEVTSNFDDVFREVGGSFMDVGEIGKLTFS